MRHHDQIQKSRLGRILVNRGYITEEQLDFALQEQVEKSCLLGEVLLEQGWISEKDLKRVLRHQKNYRFAAAAVTMVVTPLQPMMAFAASPASAIPLNGPRAELSENQLGGLKGLRVLDDEELAGVNAQGFFPGISTGISLAQNSAQSITAGFGQEYTDEEDFEEDREEQIAAELTDTVLSVVGLGPISNFIDADVTVEGLKFREGQENFQVLEDGRFRIFQPQSIDRVSIENIRVAGDDNGGTFGSIFISDITYAEGSNITISPRDSRPY